MKFQFVANKYVLPLLEKGKMLDLACGKGELIKEAKKKNIKVIGLDINKENNPDIIHDLEKPLPFSNESFQQVTCVDSMEHVKNITQLLNEVYRILKKGGIFIFSIPNTKFYRHSEHHVSYFTYKLIKQFISQTFFKIEKEIFFYFIPYLKKDIPVFTPLLASHFIFKLRKKENKAGLFINKSNENYKKAFNEYFL